MPDDHDRRSEDLQAELEAGKTCAQLRAENGRLRALLGLEPPAAAAEAPVQYALFAGAAALPPVDAHSSLSDRIAVYRSLFRGREDVYAVHWSNTRSGKSGYSPAVKGGWHGGNSRARDYLPLTDDVIEQHLGDHTVGLYPLHTRAAFETLVFKITREYVASSNKGRFVEVNGHYSKHFEALKALVDSGAA